MTAKTGSITRWFFPLLGMAFLLTACGPREIPDDKMADIIHDIILVNTYYNQQGAKDVKVDSVDIYGPVLAKYGYDAEDFRYSLDRMALRKSSRLSELIDKATSDLQAENDFYLARQRMRERVDTLIDNFYRDTVYLRLDSLWVRSRRQQDSLIITIPARYGNYSIRYGYMYNPDSSNTYLVMRYNQKDSLDEQLRTQSRALTRGGKRTMDFTFTSDSLIRYLEIVAADLSKETKTIPFRLDSVIITYNPFLDNVRSGYWKDLISRRDISIFPDYGSLPKDSGTLYLVPPLRPDTASYIDLR